MRSLLGLAVLLAVLAPLAADDWPGFRGSDRTGVSKEKGLLKVWPKVGPKLVWSTDKAGLGLSGMAVVGGTVYTMGARDDDEYAIAIDSKGKELWATKIGPTLDWKTNQWTRGPNSTPTVSGDHVYVVTSRGMLGCVKKSDGALVWKKDMVKEMDGIVHNPSGGEKGLGWGYCWSPLVDGDNVLIVPGGKKGMLALLKGKDGEEIWRSKAIPDEASYGSPVVATIDGVKQYICAAQGALYSVSAKDGSLLWKREHADPKEDLVCATPAVVGNQVFYSVGYSALAALVEVSGKNGKFTTKDVWAEEMIGNRQGGTVIVGDHIYGFHQDFQWQCQELKTGKIVWGQKRQRQAIKAGAVIAADGKLFVLAEDGTVGLLKVWTHPSLSDGKLYLRNQGDIFCYEVK
jgi:outer membrane protein assembly factor BamB